MCAVRAAIQQIENLANRNGVDRDRAGERIRGALGLHPEEYQQGIGKQRQADEDDAPDAEARSRSGG